MNCWKVFRVDRLMVFRPLVKYQIRLWKECLQYLRLSHCADGEKYRIAERDLTGWR